MDLAAGKEASAAREHCWASPFSKKRASGECDVVVTMDGNIEHQQNRVDLPFGATRYVLDRRGIVVPGVSRRRISQGEQ